MRGSAQEYLTATAKELEIKYRDGGQGSGPGARPNLGPGCRSCAATEDSDLSSHIHHPGRAIHDDDIGRNIGEPCAGEICPTRASIGGLEYMRSPKTLDRYVSALATGIRRIDRYHRNRVVDGIDRASYIAHECR